MANVLLEPLARPAFEAKIQVMLRAAQALGRGSHEPALGTGYLPR